MATTLEAPGARLRASWARLARLPGGRWLFSRLLGFRVPYTGSIRPRVLEFGEGRVRVRLRDRRRVRNHLGSVHAIALANLGELASGLALIEGLDADTRAILVGIDVRYHKKARGSLIAEARCEPAPVSGDVDRAVAASIYDAEGDVVATVEALWRLSARRTPAGAA